MTYQVFSRTHAIIAAIILPSIVLFFSLRSSSSRSDARYLPAEGIVSSDGSQLSHEGIATYYFLTHSGFPIHFHNIANIEKDIHGKSSQEYIANILSALDIEFSVGNFDLNSLPSNCDVAIAFTPTYGAVAIGRAAKSILHSLRPDLTFDISNIPANAKCDCIYKLTLPKSASPLKTFTCVDFGAKTSDENVPLKIVLKNASNRDVLLTGMSPPCGCMSISASFPIKLLSGQQIGINCNLSLSGKSGFAEWDLPFHTNTKDHVCRISGFIKSSAPYIPKVLDFGVIGPNSIGRQKLYLLLPGMPKSIRCNTCLIGLPDTHAKLIDCPHSIKPGYVQLEPNLISRIHSEDVQYNFFVRVSIVTDYAEMSFDVPAIVKLRTQE